MIGRSRNDRTRPGAEDRAQTLQDFAVGIGIFLLAVAFVFTFVPTIITPFADSGSPDTAQADRIAATIVEQASTGQANELDTNTLSKDYKGDSEYLAPKLGLRKTTSGNAIDNVNITIISLDEVSASDPSYEFKSGDEYDGQVGASATRIVTLDDDSCDPACKLVVRVW